MGKTRDLFKKIGDTKGTFHEKMGSIKDRNGLDLTEAEDIKKRCKNTQKNCAKKIFTTQIIRWCDHSPRARHHEMSEKHLQPKMEKLYTVSKNKTRS